MLGHHVPRQYPRRRMGWWCRRTIRRPATLPKRWLMRYSQVQLVIEVQCKSGRAGGIDFDSRRHFAGADHLLPGGLMND
jgi:hypothetical protein